jgi:hypothetical protein
MSIRNYDELQTSVAGWLKRTNLSDQIPDFITLAEAGFNRVLRVRQMAATYTRTTNAYTVALPDDFLAAAKIQLDGRTLTYIERYSVDSNDLGRSDGNRYTMIGSQLWLLSRVGASSVLTLDYYQRITPLSDDEPQNWLIEDAPDAYLYGSLMQAEPYLKNDQRVAIWSSLYGQIIDAMTSANTGARTSGSALAMTAS